MRRVHITAALAFIALNSTTLACSFCSGQITGPKAVATPAPQPDTRTVAGSSSALSKDFLSKPLATKAPERSERPVRVIEGNYAGAAD